MIAPQQKFRYQRVGGVARFSGLTMIILGGLSAAVTLLNPLSAEFAVSLVILVLGWVEWRLGGRLRDGQVEVVPKMVWNQIGVAVVVTLYSGWRIWATTDQAVWAILDRPEIKASLDMLDPMVRAELVGRLPGVIRLAYLIIIPVVWAGCGGMAAWYHFRTRPEGLSPPVRN